MRHRDYKAVCEVWHWPLRPFTLLAGAIARVGWAIEHFGHDIIREGAILACADCRSAFWFEEPSR